MLAAAWLFPLDSPSDVGPGHTAETSGVDGGVGGGQGLQSLRRIALSSETQSPYGAELQLQCVEE